MYTLRRITSENWKKVMTYCCLLAVIGSVACTSTKVTTSSPTSYTEDLSAYRPLVDATYQEQMEASQKASAKNDGDEKVISTRAIDAELELVIDSLVTRNKKQDFYSGYTIQLFSGQDREAAYALRNELYDKFPDLTPDISYESTRYIVRVGQYISRIEAQSTFRRIKEVYKDANVIPQRFPNK